MLLKVVWFPQIVGFILTIVSVGYLGYVQQGVIDSSHPELTVWPAIGTLLLGGVMLLIAVRLGWYGPDPADPSVFPKLFHFKPPIRTGTRPPVPTESRGTPIP